MGDFARYFERGRVFTDPGRRLWLAQLNPVLPGQRRAGLKHPLFVGYTAQGSAVVFYQAQITGWTVIPDRVAESSNESRGLLADPGDSSHFIVVGGIFLFEIPRKQRQPARFRGEVRMRREKQSPSEIRLFLDERPLISEPLSPLSLSESALILGRSAFAALEI